MMPEEAKKGEGKSTVEQMQSLFMEGQIHC